MSPKFKIRLPTEKKQLIAEIILEDIPGDRKYKFKLVRRLSDGKILKREKFLNHLVCEGEDYCNFCGDKIE